MAASKNSWEVLLAQQDMQWNSFFLYPYKYNIGKLYLVRTKMNVRNI